MNIYIAILKNKPHPFIIIFPILIPYIKIFNKKLKDNNFHTILFNNVNIVNHEELNSKIQYTEIIKNSISNEGTYTYIKLTNVKNYDKMGKKLKEIIENIFITISNKSKTN